MKTLLTLATLLIFAVTPTELYAQKVVTKLGKSIATSTSADAVGRKVLENSIKTQAASAASNQVINAMTEATNANIEGRFKQGRITHLPPVNLLDSIANRANKALPTPAKVVTANMIRQRDSIRKSGKARLERGVKAQ